MTPGHFSLNGSSPEQDSDESPVISNLIINLFFFQFRVSFGDEKNKHLKESIQPAVVKANGVNRSSKLRTAIGLIYQAPIPYLTSPLKGEVTKDFPPSQGEGQPACR